MNDKGMIVRNLQGEHSIAWEDIREIVATRSDQLGGNTILLLLALNDGRTLTVPEDDSVWHDLTRKLPKYLSGAKPYEEWALESAFSDEVPRVEVFRR
ncbi:PH domain-containing protein [Paraburkholderia sp. HP33-1]|uniref:PH domain-containing protein n=1 Tax=Paraburkholderia sp. HP33-1 TaxID=2883243 RepID=UPI001F1C860B|nr:PH domain-containing protein [Paraburkholderia sp. HP33-1]